MIVKPEGKRKKGRPRMRWMDGVEKDLRNLGVNWNAKAQDRDGWPRPTKGRSVNNNNNNNNNGRRAVTYLCAPKKYSNCTFLVVTV
jgi:hypothetical protein